MVSNNKQSLIPMDTLKCWEGTHIFFWSLPKIPGRETEIWSVEDKRGGDLGEVSWFGRWRKYTFVPEGGCVFEEVCLKEISQFIVDRTTEHKENLKCQ